DLKGGSRSGSSLSARTTSASLCVSKSYAQAEPCCPAPSTSMRIRSFLLAGTPTSGSKISTESEGVISSFPLPANSLYSQDTPVLPVKPLSTGEGLLGERSDRDAGYRHGGPAGYQLPRAARKRA